MRTSQIASIQAWEALDSRGKPTVAASVTLEDGTTASALSPSGASAGTHEALELRDGGPRYAGSGVLKAIGHINDVIAPRLLGRDADYQESIDATLQAIDDSDGYAQIGANALLAVSLATWRAAASARRVPLARLLNGDGSLDLPMPMVNIVSGGAHAGGVIDVQDFLVVPHGATSFAAAIQWASDVRREAQELALAAGHQAAVLVADEGGLGIPLASNRSALQLLTDSIVNAGLRPGIDASIAIDVAASEFYVDGVYTLASERRSLSAEGLIDELEEWVSAFPVISIEDALAEDDWDGWAAATARFGKCIELIGDDLFVTNANRLRRGIDSGAANSVLVKVNQNGVVSGAKHVMDMAKAAGYRTVVSARSGDTEDDWLVDLAVGWSAGQIKVGSTRRSERTAKWNRLLELEATEDTTFGGPWLIDGATGTARPFAGTGAAVGDPL